MRINFKFQISNFKTTIGIFILGFLVFPLFADAVLIENNNTEVINEIKVEASTGNSKVEVKTIINGEEVESISTESSEGSIKVESRVEVNKEIKSQKLKVIIQELEEKPKVFLSWWVDFIENLKSIILGIFNIFGHANSAPSA